MMFAKLQASSVINFLQYELFYCFSVSKKSYFSFHCMCLTNPRRYVRHINWKAAIFFFFSEKEEENDEVEDMEVENSMECKLSLNSYKIRFVKGSEDYLYRRQALKRAKEVSTCSDFTGSSSTSVLERRT